MNAQAVDECVTLASGDEIRRDRRPEVDYVGASPISTRVFFPGPRMQMEHGIDVGSRRYVLNGFFVIELEHEGDGVDAAVYASHRSLPVSGFGRDAKEALQAFYDAFDHQYRHLVEVEPDSLTAWARQMREAMKRAVVRIEQV